MKYDILAVTELWRKAQNSVTDSIEFISSVTERNKDGDLRFPDDPAAGCRCRYTNILVVKTCANKIFKT